MFPFFLFPPGHICFMMSQVSDTKIQISEYQPKKTTVKLGHGRLLVFFYVVGFVGERAAPYPLERKLHICVLIISSVSASNSEHQCQFERRATLRILLRNRREDTVKVTSLHNLIHRIADLGW